MRLLLALILSPMISAQVIGPPSEIHRPSPEELIQRIKSTDCGTRNWTLSKSQMHRVVALAHGLEDRQYEARNAEALVKLAQVESRFRPRAQNPRSTAYGLYQFLNGTWRGVPYDKTDDPVVQAAAAIAYVDRRYGSAENAWRFWQARRWY